VAPGAGTATGTVTFKDGTTTLGPGTLGAGGVATFTTTTLAVGPHSITGVFGGDGNFTSSTSAPLTQTVNQATSSSNIYQLQNLVSSLANPPGGAPTVVDTGLKNPWGISFSANSPLWIADQRTGMSTVYRGDVTQPDGTISPIAVARTPVTIPSRTGGTTGSPTGTVFNPTTAFTLTNGSPATFIFDGLDGTITAWNPGDVNQAELKATVAGASYTGLALGSNAAGNFLFAANNNTGKIDVFDKNFQLTTLGPGGTFEDPNLPPGSPFRAFNVQNLGGTLYVTYDKVVTFGGVTDREHDGLVDAFDTDGNFLRRVVTGGVNAPWGLALAPATFGPLGGSLLVGNFGFGDGKINAYNPTNGQFLGNLTDANGNPIVIEGLWALAFGNGGMGGDRNTLYFTAGIHRTGPGSFDAADGLFGSIRFVTPKGSLQGPDGSSGGVGPSFVRGAGSGTSTAERSGMTTALGANLLAALLNVSQDGPSSTLPAQGGAKTQEKEVGRTDASGMDQLFASFSDDSESAPLMLQSHKLQRSRTTMPGEFLQDDWVIVSDLGL
jgi:uncharacterized protein (TIGR03118 family)